MEKDPGGTLTYLNAPLLFMPAGQRGATAALVKAVAGSDAFASLIGSDGAGKTTVLDRVAAELDSLHVRVVRVAGTGGLGLLGLVAQVAGRADPAALQDEDRERAFEAMTELDDGFQRIALLVDDVQGLESAALRYIQLACRSGPMLRVVLAGPPGALDALDAEEFTSLRERIVHRVELAALSSEEAAGFAGHLLRAGGVPAGNAMTPAALDVLVGQGRGNPGRIGTLLRRTLLLGVARGEAPVRPETVEQAVAAHDGVQRAAQPAPAPLPARVPAAARTARQAGTVRPSARRSRELAWALAGLGIGASLALAVVVAGRPDPATPAPILAVAPPSLAEAAPAQVAPEAPAPTPAMRVDAVVASEPAAAPPAAGELPAAPAAEALPLPPEPPGPPADAASPSQAARSRITPEASRALRAARTAPERATFGPRIDEQRCRDIVLKAQLGEELPYGDRQFLRAGCRSGR